MTRAKAGRASPSSHFKINCYHGGKTAVDPRSSPPLTCPGRSRCRRPLRGVRVPPSPRSPRTGASGLSAGNSAPRRRDPASCCCPLRPPRPPLQERRSEPALAPCQRHSYREHLLGFVIVFRGNKTHAVLQRDKDLVDTDLPQALQV